MRLPKPKRAAKQPKPLKRTSRPRKKRKGKRASIARECDRLWSLLIRRRGRCENCGSDRYTQAAHGFSRRYRATRWLPANGFCLCRSCHVYYTHRPLEWDQWLRDPFLSWGELTYNELRYRALKNERQDMPVVLAKLREEAARLGIK